MQVRHCVQPEINILPCISYIINHIKIKQMKAI
jgi:hypothetical protein